jgi:amicyanin
MHRRHVAAAFIALASLVALQPIPEARAGTDHVVEIADFAFQPATITITAGDSVTWTNRDIVVHTATSTSGAFDSGELAEGDSYRVTFTEPGTFDYLCTPHPSMTGRVVVVAAASAAPPQRDGSEELPDVALERADMPISIVVGAALVLAALAVVIGRSNRPTMRQR